MVTRAIFIDQNNELTRCQLVGMNQKGEPEWLVVEQGRESKTLAAIQREELTNRKYRMLCIEGEPLHMQTLMRVLGSALEGEARGNGFMMDGIFDFIADMRKFQVEWPKDCVSLRFRFFEKYKQPGRYGFKVIMICFNNEVATIVRDIDDPNKWLGLIREFCEMLEDDAGMDKPYKELDISSAADVEWDSDKLEFFDIVIRKD